MKQCDGLHRLELRLNVSLLVRHGTGTLDLVAPLRLPRPQTA